MQGTVDRGELEGRTAEIIRETAIELSAAIDTLVDDVSGLIVQDVPEMLDGESYRRSIRANLDVKLSALRQGSDLVVPPAPRDALLYARDLARRGADVSVLLRAYDLGHRYFWGEWTQRFSARAADPAVLAELYDVSARFLFAYFDSVPASVTSAYRSERRRQTSTAAAERAETVCDVLRGGGDARAAELALGYPLAGARHLALVFGADAELGARDIHAATRVVQGLAARLGPASVTVRAETTTLWAWVEVPAALEPDELDARTRKLRCPDGLVLAAGDPGAGLDGFRESHREAEHALRHARARRGARVVHYRDVSAAALLGSDARRAGRFVQRELHGLAGEDDATARIRATLRAFLHENGNQAATARRLGLHYNTVAYRLRRAEELLGRPLTERRFELEAALLLQSASG
jgi:DNA-binding PucR family transcriptional regulator